MLQEVHIQGCPAKTAISAISAISPEIANKLVKSQFLLKLIKSSVTGGRRMSSKNCNFSKNCKKLEKSQFLLKLIKSSVTGGRRMSSKTAISPKIAKNWRNRSYC